MNTAAMEQPTKYWGMWGPRRSGSTTATGPSPWPAVYAGEPSWEEQAFARDAAGHLGGCVWPPRSYTCSFCRREFRSAQALGGHMNVHRRDRARLRQCASSDDIHDAHQPPQPISPCAPLDQPQHQDTVAYRALLLSNHNSPTDLPSHEAVASSTTTPPSYISAIIKESKNKTFTATGCDHDAADGNEEDRMRKRRRVEHPAVVLPFLARLSAVAACEREELQGVDDAKVPKTKSPSSSSFLVYQQEVDLELRLGSSPKVT